MGGGGSSSVRLRIRKPNTYDKEKTQKKRGTSQKGERPFEKVGQRGPFANRRFPQEWERGEGNDLTVSQAKGKGVYGMWGDKKGMKIRGPANPVTCKSAKPGRP